MLDQRKNQWQKDQHDAEKRCEKIQKDIHSLQIKISQKKNFQQLYDEASIQLSQNQQIWEELHEATPDSLEEHNLKAIQQELVQELGQLKENADLYAQIPHFQNQLTQKRQDQQQLQQRIEDQQEDLDAIGYNVDLFQNTQKNLDDARQEEKQIQNGLDQANEVLRLAQLDEQKLIGEGAQARQECIRFQEVFLEYQYEEKLWILMDDFKRHFFAANTQEVAHHTAELLRDAITDQSILGIEFGAKGQLFYKDGSSIVRSVQRLSGGEKALVGLYLRLALAEQAQTISRIGKVKFLFLDEVLASLDEERCEAVQRIFQKVLQRGIFEQIIMVTHLESVKQSWQAEGLTIQKVDSTTSTISASASQHTYYEVLEEIGV